MLLDGPVGFPGSRELLGLIIALSAAALATLIIGLSGRRSILSSIVVLGLALATIGAGVGDRVIDGGRGERTWTPVASASEQEFDHGAGITTLDLRPLIASQTGSPAPSVAPSAAPSVAPSAGAASPTPSSGAVPAVVTPQRIDVEQGAGELTIIVPAGANAQIRAEASFGEVQVRGNLPEGLSDRDRGNNDSPSETLNLTLGTGAPTVIVDASITFGQITIQEG